MPISKYYPDAQLVCMLKNHEADAYAYLYDNYSKQLYFLILSIVSNPELACDVLQEVFIKIWRGIDTYEEHGKLFTWLLKIAKTTSFDAIKSKSFKNNMLNCSNISVTDKALPSTSFYSDGIGVYKFIKHLPQDYKALIMLSYYEGFTHQQIAEILRIPQGTVKTRLKSALNRLKAMMM